MIEPSEVIQQVTTLTSKLIELSLCNEQNYPSVVRDGSVLDISFSGQASVSTALRNIPYRDIYSSLDYARAYNFKMVDGALVQLQYSFRDNDLCSHRLAFFPSPDLDDFQNNSEIYETEEVYAEIIMRNIVPFPVRFDYDSSDNLHVPLNHPKSHLTLGQYLNCRIPVSAPIPPLAFADFLLRNFYNTAHRRYCEELPTCDKWFPLSLHETEQSVIHLRCPS